MKTDNTPPSPSPWPSLLRLLRLFLVNNRRVGLGGAVLTALGLGAYSSVAPEDEARTIYQILRPVVQSNANEIVALRLRIEYLERALETQKARNGDASKALAPFGGAAPAPAPPPSKNPEVKRRDFGIGEPVYVELPSAPWRKAKDENRVDGGP